MAEETKVKCSKCSSENIHTRYCEKGEYVYKSSGKTYTERHLKAENECLVRFCRGCGYHWITDIAPPTTEEFAHG